MLEINILAEKPEPESRHGLRMGGTEKQEASKREA
jgi:hypothetical protein